MDYSDYLEEAHDLLQQVIGALSRAEEAAKQEGYRETTLLIIQQAEKLDAALGALMEV